MIFDAGVFIKAESPPGARRINALMQRLKAQGVTPSTNVGVLAQVWRDPAKQVGVTILARSCDVVELGDPRSIGSLCAASGTGDVVDASLAVLAASTGMAILTTDPDDMTRLGAKHVSL